LNVLPDHLTSYFSAGTRGNGGGSQRHTGRGISNDQLIEADANDGGNQQ
jgi:hypothetical protein